MAAKKYLIGIGAAALIYLLMKPSKSFGNVTAENLQRGCDPLGCGHFGASRGSRKHNGVDIIATPGESIFAPITGKVSRIAYPYANDTNYKGIEIIGADYKIKMFYLAPSVAVGSVVMAGQVIGVAQNISAKHGQSMVNHVHLEVYDKFGNLVNPTDLIKNSLNRDLLLKVGVKGAEVAVLQRLLTISSDGIFGTQTEAALLANKGVKQITLNNF